MPDSCCVDDMIGCGQDIFQQGATIYRSGCLDSLSNMMRDKVAMVGGIVIAVTFVQVGFELLFLDYLVIFSL